MDLFFLIYCENRLEEPKKQSTQLDSLMINKIQDINHIYLMLYSGQYLEEQKRTTVISVYGF